MEIKKIERVNLLIQKIKRNDSNAVEKLYEEISRTLYFTAIKYLKNSFDAEDAVQEFWLHIDLYCQKATFLTNGYAYLMKVFTNLCKDKLRIMNRERQKLTARDIIEYENLLSSSSVSLYRQSLRESFLKAESKMNDKEKTFFALFCYGEESIREIAEEMEISKSQAGRLRKKVIAILIETLTEDGWDKEQP